MIFFLFQDLLQMQYEGVAVMKMFDKAKVNVNLLIFLLNKKFYGKWILSDIMDFINQWEVCSVFFFAYKHLKFVIGLTFKNLLTFKNTP